MVKILLVDHEPLICEVIADYFQQYPSMIVRCLHNGADAACVITRERFDIALIEVTLPGLSGYDLAAVAANENTPVLLISGDVEANLKLNQFCYPYLTKPFSLLLLRTETERVILERRENIACIKASTERMLASARRLIITMQETDRLLDETRRSRQLGRWGNRLPGPAASGTTPEQRP